MIRPARAEDADALVAIEQAVFGAEAWSAVQVQQELEGSTRTVLVADVDRDVLGFVAIAVAGDIADLTRIAVVGAKRRSGIATELLAAGEAQAVEGGAERILLEVAAANSVAQAFYRARGYDEIARRRRYYANGDDALVFARALG